MHSYANQLGEQRQVPDVTGSGAKMAQKGGNGVFWGKTVEKDMEMKKKLRGAATYFRMSTDQRQVPDVTGSGAIMAKVGGNGVFWGKTVEKDMKKKRCGTH